MKSTILIGVACLVLIFVLFRYFKCSREGTKEWQSILDKGALIVDVRSAQEFDQAHYKDAQNVPLPLLESKIDSLKQLQMPLIVCCASGVRSARAAKMLKDAGMTVYDAGSWTNLPN